jgi:hypothetical protein
MNSAKKKPIAANQRSWRVIIIPQQRRISRIG